MAEIRKSSWKYTLVQFCWDRQPLWTCSPTDCPTGFCLVTVKHFADSHVVTRQESSSNSQVPRREQRISQKNSTFYLRRVHKHFTESAQFRLSRHIIRQNVKKVTGKILHCRIRYSNVVWIFKAADGQKRRVKEGGLGLELILHLEEFSSWPQWWSTGEQVFLLKANDTWGTRWFH